MQSMLSAFAGYTVDWARGQVSFGGVHAGSRITLRETFWTDLAWWRVHLAERYSIQWTEQEVVEAAITGTDASGWGTGQLAWVDGQRLEQQLQFTRAEQGRPINWRELLGIVRVVERYGPQLEGRTVLIETDNMAAKCSSARRSSKAPDMQELIRRLVDLCERHHIRLRLTHTPGAKLDRPDQSSRGDPVEEPRQRLASRWFAQLERAYGQPTRFLGPERGHRSSDGAPAPADGIFDWFHPTFATVGSALRLLHERAARALESGTDYRALALVPSAPGAAWNSLVKHSAVVGRLAVGSGAFEEHRGGAWRTVPARRDMLLVAYPRVAGGRVWPALLEAGVHWRRFHSGEGGARVGARWLLPV